MMPLTPFDGLPHQATLQVIQHLKRGHPSWSLWSLARVSKASHALIAPYLYETVKLWLEDERDSTIWRNAVFLRRILAHRGALDHVKCLMVNSVPALTVSTVRLHGVMRQDATPYLARLAKEKRPGLGLDLEKEILSETIAYREDPWEALADLIRELPALADLYYTALPQIAPCLLDALQMYAPRCRLWLNTFHLGTSDGNLELALAQKGGMNVNYVTLPPR